MSTEVTICESSNCDHPADGGFICRTTLGELEQLLAETTWLVHELDTAMSKQTQFAPAGGKITTKGGEQQLIFNPDASDALRELTGTLLSWQANLADALGIPVRYPSPTQGAAWLLGHLEDIRVFVAAGDLVDEVEDTHQRARKLIDRPTERRYLGDCGATENDTYCGEPLWGADRQALATCKACGTVWLQDARLRAIHEQAAVGLNDRIMTASEAAACLVAYNLAGDTDEIRMTDRIRKWAEQPKDPDKKPRLVKRTDLRLANERPRPGYKFGEILDILNQMNKKKSA